MDPKIKRKPEANWRQKIHEVIFEAETPMGKAFDIILMWAIILSVMATALESVTSIRDKYGALLNGIEWFFTILFTIEYILRLISVRMPWRYAFSFFGIVDILSIAPTYISYFVPGIHYMQTIRVLRLLRVFRVLKLTEYLSEAQILMTALRASSRKIGVFLLSVVSLVTVFGSIMYVVEGEENGFTSIPKSIYWAIVTLTTVGYGDVSPQTPVGQFLASVVMILGYGIIAVPTGIVTVELNKAISDQPTKCCPSCGAEGHDQDASHCKYCGAELN